MRPFRHVASARGLSLIEVTVMLAVVCVLAGALVPVVSDSIGTARLVRARNDVSQIASGLVNFQRDVGQVLVDGSALGASGQPQNFQPIDVLMTGGDVPELASGADESLVRGWIESRVSDALDAHLRINGRNYPMAQRGPGSGWNGPYVMKEVIGDPWGNRYLVNTGFLRENAGATGRCTSCAVFVISAGPDGILQTPFQQPIGNANTFGDDIAVRIQ